MERLSFGEIYLLKFPFSGGEKLKKDLIYKKLGQINEELTKEIKKKFKNIIE